MICSKCNHHNVLLNNPDFFLKIFKGISDKNYKIMNHAGLDKDKFYNELQKNLNTNNVYKYDVYEIDNHPNYKYFAQILIEI